MEFQPFSAKISEYPDSMATYSNKADSSKGIEGGEIFAVDDEPLENMAGQVVFVKQAVLVNALGSVGEGF